VKCTVYYESEWLFCTETGYVTGVASSAKIV